MTTMKYDVKLIDSDGNISLETKETFERYKIPVVIKYKHLYFGTDANFKKVRNRILKKTVEQIVMTVK